MWSFCSSEKVFAAHLSLGLTSRVIVIVIVIVIVRSVPYARCPLPRRSLVLDTDGRSIDGR